MRMSGPTQCHRSENERTSSERQWPPLDRLDLRVPSAGLLSRIRRGAASLHTQLRDFLTFARGDVRKIEINPMPFDAGELVSSVIRVTRSEATAKGLELVVADAPEERPASPFNGYLTKPITKPALQRAIDRPVPVATAMK